MAKIDWRHLRCFAAVVEAGSFIGAAKMLHTQQPPVSRMIKELEIMLGVQLIDRYTRPVRLTEHGKIFYEDTQSMFRLWEQAKKRVRQGINASSLLRFAISDDIEMHRVSELLALSRDEEPEVDIELFEMPLSEQIHKLQNHELDIGIAHANVKAMGVISIPLWRDRIVAILPSKHPLLAYKTIPVACLLEYPFISYDPVHCKGSHDQIHAMLNARNATVEISAYAKSFDLMRVQVCSGYGISLIGSTRFGCIGCKNIVARHLEGTPKYLTTYLLLPDMPQSATLENMVRRIKSLDGTGIKLHIA